MTFLFLLLVLILSSCQPDADRLVVTWNSADLIHMRWDSTKRVLLTWSQNEEADLAGYKMYSGPTSHDYNQTFVVGFDTSAKVLIQSDGGFTYFAVTAIDSSGNESNFSEEVRWPPGDSLIIPPVDSCNGTYIPANSDLEGYVLVDKGFENDIAELDSTLTEGSITFESCNSGSFISVTALNDADGADLFNIYVDGFNVGTFNSIGNDEWADHIIAGVVLSGQIVTIECFRSNAGTKGRVLKVEVF